MKKTDIFEQYPHLKSEWIPTTNHIQQKYYKHTYSDDQSQVISLKSVPMKEVDIYSSREGYSFPFCPRIYKYVIEKNYQEGNHLCFDLVVLYQRVSSRLCQNFLLNATDEQITFLTSKVSQIVKGFQYLYRRFGCFEITQKMIGWTQLGIVKVWLNEDFYLNTKSNPNASQESMVKSLITILQQNTMIKNKSFKKCTTFQALLDSLLHPEQRRQSEVIKQVAFKPIQNFNAALGDLYYNPLPSRKQFQRQQVKSVKTRKNITFSYSNKDLNAKSNKDIRAANKRCSILMSYQDQAYIFNRLAQNHLESQAIDKTPPSSLKAILPLEKRANKKKTSQFIIEDVQEKFFNQNELKVEKEDNYSKTTVSYRNESLLKNQHRIRPEILHYSTSSNPISKFLNVTTISSKAYSSKGSVKNDEIVQTAKRESCESNLSDLSAKDFRQRIQQNFEGLPLKIEQKEQETNMRQSQQIQRDLDALFHSDHQFDYNELENELDCIL